MEMNCEVLAYMVFAVVFMAGPTLRVMAGG